MKLKRSKFADIVLSAIGDKLRGVALGEARLVVLGGGQRHVRFCEIATPAVVEERFAFSALSVSCTNGSRVRLRGSIR